MSAYKPLFKESVIPDKPEPPATIETWQERTRRTQRRMRIWLLQSKASSWYTSLTRSEHEELERLLLTERIDREA